MQPLILLTTSFWEGAHSRRRALSVLYGEAVSRAGGLPATFSGGDPKILAKRCAGLVLTGGGDVDPARYGAARLPTDEVDAGRDAEELALIDAFLAEKRPIFGICRGIQLLNVYFGGTLAQDIPGHSDGARHIVTTAENSRLRAACGARFETNSWHHQAVQTVAPALRASALSEDGTIEGIEHPFLPVFAVQWHPERMINGLCSDVGTDQLCLFTYFIKECEKRYESAQNRQS